MKKGKRYVESAKLIDRSKQYETGEAIELALQTAKAKFDETMELHVRLGVDPRHADQQVRGVVVLPNGTGKTVRVLVIAKGEKADEATKAGADFVGAEEIIQKIQTENWFDFDVCITSPDMMGLVGRIGKLLGPKGLMPNPKSGTVTQDITKAIKTSKQVRWSTEWTKPQYATSYSAKRASAKRSLWKTFPQSWTPSSRRSLRRQKALMSKASPFLRRWDPA